MFDVVFLIIWILVVLGLVLYLFYWNRVLSLLLSLLVRVLLWNQASASTWIDIGSIQFSILAGRIIFKDLRYYTSNQTVRLVKGQLSWRYWIRKPTEEGDLRYARVGAEDVGRKATWPLACRVHLSVQGAEWFLYNRTAAYDDIISQMSGEPLHRSYTAETQQSTAPPKEPDYDYPPRTSTGSGSLLAGAPSTIRKALEWIRSQLPRIEFNDLLPISMEVEKGAIICGNASTPNLLVAEYTMAEGTYGIVPSRSTCDLYKQLLSVKFCNASIHYVANPDYATSMPSTGQELHNRIHESQARRRHLASYLQYGTFLKLWRRLSLGNILTPPSRPLHPRPPAQPHVSTFRRRKINTNPEDETPVGADFSVLEYAIERKILEAPILELSYYADVVGTVPHDASPNPSDPFDIGNGDLPPEWGFDLVIRNGFLRYGPWADRQRAELQRTFFPPVYQNSSRTPLLRPGDTRVWPSLKVFVELRDTTTLQIPFREASKDWQWDGLVDYRRPRKREAASFFFKAGENSTINYILPMIIGSEGYEPVLEVTLDTVTLTSSMNDYQLLSAESCSVRSAMPSPLKWNSRRQWDFYTRLRKPVMYLLREHINMFADLGKDWSAGPPSDHYRFIPMVYALDLELRMFELNTYVNDHNIIDKPSIREENGLLTIRGVTLKTNVEIDSTTFRPISSIVPFSFLAPDLSVSLSLPRWNTHSMNPQPEIGRIGELTVTGSYRYFSDVRPDNVDKLRLNIDAKNLVLKTFGWVIRHFMVMRDNYFGSFTQFHTLYEYLQKKDKGLPISDPTELKYRLGKSNLFEVVLEVNANQNLFVLPAKLPGFDAPPELRATSPGLGPCLVFSVPNVQVHLRTHDYVMEMSLNAEPLSGSIVGDFPDVALKPSPQLRYGRESLFIDGLDIVANRLFGPQPKTSTYVCIWEIHAGHVKSCLSTPQADVVIAALRLFDSGFDDALDAPAKEVNLPLDPDVTFLKVSIDGLDLAWKAGGAALHLYAPKGVRIDFNDLAGKTYKKVNSVRLRQGVLKLLLAAGPNQSSWLEAARAEVDCCIDLYRAPKGWQEAARKQAKFIVDQDAPTGRAKHLIMLHGWTEEFIREPAVGYKAKEFHYTELRLPVVRDPEPVGVGHDLWIHEEERSESENDEPISPAVRDERLAKSRLATPLPSPMEEYISESSMASGDESDDEDLTEPDGYDSDTEDGNQHVVLLMSRYRRCSRLYWRNTHKEPSFWGDTAYQMLKDRTPLVEPHTSSNRNVLSNDDDGLAMNHNQDTGSENTIIRVRVEHGIKVSLTALVAPTVALFFQDMVLNRPSPELYLDAVIQGYVSSFSDKETPGEPSATLLDIQLPSVQVNYLHILPAAKQEGRSNAYMNMMLLSLSSLRFSGSLSPLPSFSAAVGGVSISVLSAPRPTSAQPRALLRRVSGLDIKTCRVSANSGVLACHISSLTSTFSQRSPFHVATISASLASCVKKIHSQHLRWRSQSSSITRQTIRHILQVHQGRDVLDPLSAHRPAYLVHRGKPYRLRLDSSFRFLFRLRYLLGQLDAAQRKEMDAFIPNVTVPLDDLLPFLFGTSDSGPLADPDVNDPQDTGILHALFPDSSPQPADVGGVGGSPIRSFTLSLDRLSIIVWDPANRSRNEVAMKSLAVSCSGHSSTLIQPALSRSPTIKDRQQRNALRRIVASVAVDDCIVTIFPHALDFAQQVLSAVPMHRPPSTVLPGSPSMSVESLLRPERKATSFDVAFTLRRSSLRAATEKLIIEFQANGLTIASSALLECSTPDTISSGSTTSMNHSLIFSKVVLRACAAGVPEAQDQHVLASLSFEDGKSNAVFRQEQLSSMASRVVLSLGALELSVPRSAMRLYKFAEEWRADYLPGLERTMRAIVSEVRRKPENPTPKKPSKPVAIHVNALFPSIRISLQVMHGTWLAWEVVDTIAFFRSSAAARLRKAYSFGIQVRQQVFSISSQPHWLHGLRKRTRVKFAIPMISVQGKFDGTEVQAMVLVEFFNLTFRPSHWDTVLTVQQKFGQDFNDLISLVNEKRSVTTPKIGSVPLSPHPQSPSRIKLGGVVKMKGFRIGLEGPSSVLFLECQNIGGRMQENYGHSWELSVQDLALSLAPRTHSDSGSHSFDRINRTAFVSIDFRVSTTQSPSSATHTLDITVTKVHAVMQPSSISQLGDFLDHIQAELKLRAEQRAKELSAFKEKTREFIKTFESSKPGPDTIQSWISDFLINFTFKNIGIAFPLDFDPSPRVERSESGGGRATGAFLLSVKSLSFGVQRGESGQAVMKGTALQFVSRFRQSIPSDFIEESHQTRNKLLYPEMTAQVKTDRSRDSRMLRFNADVSGFILDIDSSIPVYVFSLVDVYQRGKERFDRMAESIESMPRSFSSFDATPRIPLASLEPHYDALPTSNVVGSLIFHSGKVRLYCDATPTYSRIRSISVSGHEVGEDYSLLEASADVFNLPEVSVWAEYRARSASGKIKDLGDVSTLMFKSTIHSSSNMFKPTFLPFLRELVDHVQNRLNRSTPGHTKRPSMSTPRPSPSPLIPYMAVGGSGSVTSMLVSFSLRIDQSKLELTCQPDANVIAGVHWESGGFVVNVSPEFKLVAFTGSVGGLSVGLKHGFLSEDCVHLNANNLSFNVTIAESEYGGMQKTLSAVIDTEFTGGVRFSRLQDILCFKAVWLDRIPVFTTRSESPAPSIIENSPIVTIDSSHQYLDTAVLVRLRHMKLDVDFGQSITSTNIEFSGAVLRTKITKKIYEFSLEVAKSSIEAAGNISGRGSVPDFLFRTKRKRDRARRAVDATETEMLNLTMTSGPLDLTIESDHQRILHYHAEPLQVMIFDDWTMISPTYPEIERKLRLSFTVVGKEVTLISTVETIPQLVSYANKFSANLEAQREGAIRESKAFRISASPKPDNPLSDVANAMFQSARSKFKEAEDGLTHTIRQQMSLRLDTLRLIVFPRTMHDHEMVHFLGSSVHAKLDRVLELDNSWPKRDLELSFASLSISKLNQTRYPSVGPKDNETASVYILDAIRRSQEAIIFGLPSMKIRMVTNEEKDQGLKKIYYDFASKFIQREGMANAEDIFVTLNLSLYSWLTILRKNFTKEMNQVQAATERPATTPNLKKIVKTAEGIPDDLGIPSIAFPSDSIPFPPASPPVEGLPSAPLSAPASRSFTPSQISTSAPPQAGTPSSTSNGIEYIAQHTLIEKLTMRQLGEATPDVMHPFFMKKAGFNLEESLPQYVHEYATLPTEEIMKALLRLYSKQLKTKHLS